MKEAERQLELLFSDPDGMQNPATFYDEFDNGVFEVSKPSKRCQTLLRSSSRPDEASLNSGIIHIRRKLSVPEVRIEYEGEIGQTQQRGCIFSQLSDICTNDICAK
jgi:hypothetical protein